MVSIIALRGMIRDRSSSIGIAIGIDLSAFIKSNIKFKGHMISTKKQTNNVTKVSFRNVPFNIPDEEIIQLCNCYGKTVNNEVHYERMYNSRNRGMVGSTRWVEMEFNPGCSMNNFYWLKGPLQGDNGTRITVLHNGQEQQCSNCLRTGRGGCRAQGNGKACAEIKNPRARMSDYMADLKRLVGYESMKSQYMQQFPSLQTENINHMEERPTGDDDENEDDLIPSNPIERRDARIAELEKNLDDVSSLKESMMKMKAELRIARKDTFHAKKKLSFARTVTEQRLKECLPVPSFEDDHSSVLITLMSTLLEENAFEIDSETDTLKPKEDLLKDIEESFEENTDTVIKERLNLVRNKLLERVRDSVTKSRERRLSISSSVGSQDGRKRRNSTELGNDPVRSKESSPISSQ